MNSQSSKLPLVIVTIIALVFTAIFGLLCLDDDDFMVFFLIPAIVLAVCMICVNYYVALEFASIAEKKGFLGTTYFWYTFLLGAVGALMVVALPDRGDANTNCKEA